MKQSEIQLTKLPKPMIFTDVAPTFLTDETMDERKQKVLENMKSENYDTLVIYADKEHGGNFEYLTGFIPRFEEGLLVLDVTGESTLILGNENLKMAKVARIENQLIHSPLFSLPNQPMDNEARLENIFEKIGLSEKRKIGVVGWKMFTTAESDNEAYFDLPYFIIQALLTSKNDQAVIKNAAHLFIRGDKGARTTNNVNEIAHYEYGANLSSICILKAMDMVEVGITEATLGNELTAEGQTNTVVTIAATGQRFEFGNIYPTHKQVKLGDPLSLTTAFKGGLSSRTGFVIENEKQLPENQQDYLERVAKPYYQAVAIWLEKIKIGMAGKKLYQTIETVFPQADYHWHLNPGHLVSDEEWMSSPIYANSEETLKSGMILQIDIIPSVAGYTGVSAEECVALADATLQTQIKEKYPELWQRIIARKAYIRETLNIELSEDVIPLSNTVGYLRPFYLAKDQAFHCVK
ncbi:M24 family metallopeptidase [Candidatus Enterococcus ikei]|uniref:M24 family metallopeptidase n=1 Tax=Candidatus Enterococcus ikei TaxID=2815326 RepID=A0ABS3H3D5_9ENTE|nr:aminopeptidase P family protein [Enterococcus sp. DIV0869a]MBO0441668.1 M24 family metallopeptidase [Enterococcus sp. DIV0869a]